MGKSKVKTVQEIKELEFDLTRDELADRAVLVGDLTADKVKLETKLDAAKRDLKGQIDVIESKIMTTIQVIQSRKERRTVECEKRMDYERELVEFVFEGEVKETRPMYQDEKQVEIFAEKSAKKLKESKEAKQESIQAEEIDSDIRDVIRQETNKNTKVDISTK